MNFFTNQPKKSPIYIWLAKLAIFNPKYWLKRIASWISFNVQIVWTLASLLDPNSFVSFQWNRNIFQQSVRKAISTPKGQFSFLAWKICPIENVVKNESITCWCPLSVILLINEAPLNCRSAALCLSFDQQI